MYAANPVRETWVDVSIPGAHGSATGLAVDMGNFVGTSMALITAGAGVGAATTVTFQTAKPSATNPCVPDTVWTAVNNGGFCGETPTPLAVVINPAVAPYSTDAKQICRVPLPCSGAFVRAILSAASPAITVHIEGKARRLAEI